MVGWGDGGVVLVSQPPSAGLWALERAAACNYVKPASSAPQLPDHLHSVSCAQTLGYWSCGQHELSMRKARGFSRSWSRERSDDVIVTDET